MDRQYRSLRRCKRYQLPNYPGVYFLRRGETVIYIGGSQNAAVRLAAHVGKKDFDSVLVMSVEESNVRQVERYWIRRLKPELNKTNKTNIAKEDPRWSRISVRFPVRLADKLEKVAHENYVNQTTYLIQLLQKHFKKAK